VKQVFTALFVFMICAVGVYMVLPASTGPIGIEAVRYGDSPHGYLGLFTASVSDSAIEPADSTGVVVIQLTDAGPAALAGIQIGDRLLTVNGEPIRTHMQLVELLVNFALGENVKLRIARGTDTFTKAITLTDHETMLRLWRASSD